MVAVIKEKGVGRQLEAKDNEIGPVRGLFSFFVLKRRSRKQKMTPWGSSDWLAEEPRQEKTKKATTEASEKHGDAISCRRRNTTRVITRGERGKKQIAAAISWGHGTQDEVYIMFFCYRPMYSRTITDIMFTSINFSADGLGLCS